MMDFFVGAAYAMGQAPNQPGKQPGMLEMLFPFIIMPQRKERKKREQMLKGLKTGDKVVTSGGIYGEIVRIEDDAAYVKVDANVKLKMLKTVLTVINETPAVIKEK